MHRPHPRDELKDALAERNVLDRPNYALGVMLDDEDFFAEQTYHRGRLARALINVHGRGTVAGLEVVPIAAVPPAPDNPGRGEEVEVRPGVALDAVGRLIDVPTARCLEVPRWWAAEPADRLTAAFKPARGGVVADLFIRFAACLNSRTPAFAHGPHDALDATVYERIRDQFELRLAPRSEDPPPVPADPWDAITGGTVAQRLEELRRAILARDARLTALREQDRTAVPVFLGRDHDWVLLARIVFPATLPAGADRPERGAAAPQIDNLVRPFVVGAAGVARALVP
jgi:hypothetical protein